jgi:hypothetical protein
MSFIPFP